ncbi:G2/M phase-specific E3 ubiquitin-protein ligase-like [Xenia sp. Carnegie-2017]|uniref:G2/M phase-specific E3 ubiquitin-protein ligase-like n=1 Tax=Xenia sp. Carnegie-2017 TaxID=2897299 RepID=UPI001F032E5E|nr:G2/M phase-specific E3 ubiquitin-protein ligase-like [Xenia sp. Carnegie-2017]
MSTPRAAQSVSGGSMTIPGAAQSHSEGSMTILGAAQSFSEGSTSHHTTSTIESNHYRSFLGLLDPDPIEISDDDNDEVQTAIQNSMGLANDSSAQQMVSTVLNDHIDKVMVGKSCDVAISKNIINVRRKHVFEDGIAKLGKKKFDPSRPLSVMFADEIGSSEGAVDLGGPTREFLRLAVSGAFSSKAFLGLPSKKVLVMNQEAKRKNLYFQCGKLLSVSLCNGGTAGHCLSPSMYDFIVFGEENCHPCIDDVQDCEVKSIIERVNICFFINSEKSDVVSRY